MFGGVDTSASDRWLETCDYISTLLWFLSTASSPPAPRLRRRTASSGHPDPSQQRSRSRSRSRSAATARPSLCSRLARKPQPPHPSCSHHPTAPRAGPPPGVFFNARRPHRTTRRGSTTLTVLVRWVRRLTAQIPRKKMLFSRTVRQTPRPSWPLLLTRTPTQHRILREPRVRGPGVDAWRPCCKRASPSFQVCDPCILTRSFVRRSGSATTTW